MAARILVIEDQEDIRNFLDALLVAEGHQVDYATDGREGVSRAQTHCPDLILLDLMMPQMHGYEVIQHLRAAPKTQRVPIIVMSVKSYPSDQRKALDMGGTVFLQKPIDPKGLLEAVALALHSTQVTFWGVRGSIAAPGPETVRYGGNTPCVSIEQGGTTLIFDSGTGIRKLGAAIQANAQGKPQEINLFLSHTHWDHIQGFPFFTPAFVPGNRLHIFGPRSASKPLEKVVAGQMESEYFPVSLADMAARIDFEEYRGQHKQVGHFVVSATYINHPGVTLAYRIDGPGPSIGYATDVEPNRRRLPGGAPDLEAEQRLGREVDPGLIELLSGVDVLIADAQYSPEEYLSKVGWGHTSYLDTVELAIAAKVRKLVLFSHDAAHDDDAIDRKVAACRAHAVQRGADLDVVAAAEGAPLLISAKPKR